MACAAECDSAARSVGVVGDLSVICVSGLHVDLEAEVAIGGMAAEVSVWAGRSSGS